MSATFETIMVGPIRVHVCSTEKFKTTTLVAFIQQELTPEFVTQTVLLPAVLQRGTASYPMTLDLKRKLEDLYGASLSGDVFKRGESHIVQTSMQLANEKYLNENRSLLKEGLALFMDILFHPLVEDGGFKACYLQGEKKNLKQKIESVQDDKASYASQRLIEVMCEGESYAIPSYGCIEDLPSINEKSLYTYYEDVMNGCPIDLYCVGDISSREFADLLRQMMPSHINTERKKIQMESTPHSVKDIRVVVDKMDVKQGKLNLGCRSNVSVKDPLYPAMLVYNGILGGFPHSKLFTNVREKESLAYYASSRLESYKGLLTIQSGIEIANYDQALQIIKEQLKDLASGKITEDEIEKTKATLSNQIREQQDRSFHMIHFHYNAVLTERQEWTPELLLEKIRHVTKEEIQQVARGVQLDTIYFLRDKKEGVDHAKN